MQLNTIYRAKLSPQQIRTNHLRRNRLNELLSAGSTHKLTIVSAPAGYGKSSLIADWLTTREVPRAFISLDAHDDDVLSFAWMMIGALRATVPDSMVSLSRLISQSETPHPASVGSALAWDLDQIESNLLIVLDDFHELKSGALHELTAWLIRYLPEDVHLVVSTRGDPPLPLASLRARGELAEIRSDELRFNRDEVEDFVEQSLGNADNILAAMLFERTEGWPAGLHLYVDEILRSQRLQGDEQLGWLSGGEHAQNFLREEVLGRLSPEDQAFLTRTSILERFCSPLCDALSPDAGARRAADRISRLRQENCLIETLGSPANWFRYHPLLRSTLRAELVRTESPAVINDLHTRASQWLAENGFVTQALHHALEMHDLALCVRIFNASFDDFLNCEDWATLEQILRLFPEEVVERTPSCLIAKLWTFLIRNKYRALGEGAQRLQVLLDSQATLVDTAMLDRYYGQLEVLRASLIHASGRGDEARIHASRALDLLPTSSKFARGHAEQSLAFGHVWCGDVAAAEQRLTDLLGTENEPHPAYRSRLLQGLVYTRATNADLIGVGSASRQLLALSTRHDLGLGLGWSHLSLGYTEYEMNQVDSARSHFSAAIAMRDRTHTVAIREARLALAQTAYLSGNTEFARGLTAAGIEEWEQGQSEADLLSGYSFEARLLLDEGRAQEALVRIRSLPDVLPPGRVWDFEVPAHTRARVHMAQGDDAHMDAARVELERLVEWYETHPDRWRLVQARAMLALAIHARGQERKALEMLGSALQLAEPAGLVRSFLDLGPSIAPLLSTLGSQWRGSSYVSRLLTELRRAPAPSRAGERIDADDDAGLYETLTWRELEILQLLEARLSNKEIASTLTVTVETVKKHAGNIYRKLNVDGRRDAVNRARDLRLLTGLSPAQASW